MPGRKKAAGPAGWVGKEAMIRSLMADVGDDSPSSEEFLESEGLTKLRPKAAGKGRKRKGAADARG